MSGDLLLVLLLAMPVAQADKKPGAEHAAGAAPAQVAPAKTKAAQEGMSSTSTNPMPDRTAEAQAETKKAPGRPEPAQAKTEAVQGQPEEAQAQTDKDPKLTSVPGANALGMSVLGNQEAPTSLVIVPWKSSEVGRRPGISPMLDDSRQPVDKEVFMRALRYYEIRSEKKP